MLGAATTATAATLKELFTDARAQTTKTKRNETKRTQKDDDDDAGDDAATPRPPLTLAQVLSAEQRVRERERQDFALCDCERAQTKTNKANEKLQKICKNDNLEECVCVCVCVREYEYVRVCINVHTCVYVSGVALHGIVVVAVAGVSFVLGSLCACLSRDCLCQRTRRCRRRVPLLPA